MSELYSKEYCPACGKANWTYCGDSDDCTSGDDFDGIECHACGHKWLIVDRFELECKYCFDEETTVDEHGKTLEDYIHYEKGSETP